MSDLISRQAVIDAIVNSPSRVQDEDMPITDQYDGATFRQIEILGIIDTLPSTEPKKGRWIIDKYPLYTCSECGGTFQDVGYGFDYCPNCGARMEEENGRFNQQTGGTGCSE